jgi:hypothetical protein
VHRPATIVKSYAHCDVRHHHTFLVDVFYKIRIISGKKKKVITILPALFEISYKVLKQYLVHGPEGSQIIC